MQILKTEKQIEIVFYIETDEDYYNSYRRDNNGNWECSMGESWETVHGPEKLEKLFQAHQKPANYSNQQRPPYGP